MQTRSSAFSRSPPLQSPSVIISPPIQRQLSSTPPSPSIQSYSPQNQALETSRNQLELFPPSVSPTISNSKQSQDLDDLLLTCKRLQKKTNPRQCNELDDILSSLESSSQKEIPQLHIQESDLLQEVHILLLQSQMYICYCSGAEPKSESELAR